MFMFRNTAGKEVWTLKYKELLYPTKILKSNPFLYLSPEIFKSHDHVLYTSLQGLLTHTLTPLFRGQSSR